MHSHRRLATNATFAFALNLSLRAAGTLTFIALGRLDQPASAGTFSLALGYLAILNTLFLGLDDVLVRECARTPQRTTELAATYGILRLTASIVAWGALILLLRALGLYSVSDWTLLVIITSSILLDTFSSIGQSIMFAFNSFGWPVVSTAAMSLARVGGALLALFGGSGLFAVAWAWPIGSLVGILVLVMPLSHLLQQFGGWRALHLDRGLTRRLFRTLRGFSAVSILAGLEYQLDVVLLSILLSRTDVAWYSAAVTIMLIVLLISQAYRMALYPALVAALNESTAAAARLLKKSTLLMVSIALPAAAVISLTASFIVHLLYGSAFVPTIAILQVLIWNVVFFFVNVPLVRFMLATDGQAVVWKTLLISLTVNMLANMILIPQVGVVGAAYARLCSSGLFCVLMGWQVMRRVNRSIRQPIEL
jgi:O-antigen/teichoic acid export membrane protein